VVGAKTVLAGAAVDERVAEARDVTRGFPRARVLDDRRVEQQDVAALAHRVEPALLDVVLEQHAVVAVVVGRPDSAVDVARREDEPAPAAEGGHLLDRGHAFVRVHGRERIFGDST
jgi:hypothetical protein